MTLKLAHPALVLRATARLVCVQEQEAAARIASVVPLGRESASAALALSSAQSATTSAAVTGFHFH